MRVLLVSLLLLLGACDQAPTPPPPGTETAPAPLQPAPLSAEAQALKTAVEQASDQRLRRLNATANGFADAITGLLDDPGDERLATAQQAWEHFYAGFNQAAVILECRAQSSEHGQARLARSDPFPILPGYIDSLARWPGSGIVNDTNVSLTRKALLEQQGATSDAEASLGFQVIQFLLFGEPDHPRAVADLTLEADTDIGAGQTAQEQANGQENVAQAQSGNGNATNETAVDSTPADATPSADDAGLEMVADYAPLPPGNQVERRRAYLATATELLVEDTLLLAHNNSALPQSVEQCPVTALRRVTARLLLLANLDEKQTVDGDYMALNAQQIARDNLHQALTGWLEKDGALAAWAYSRDESIRPALEPLLAAPPAANDVQALQQLHAMLASLGQ